MSSATPGRIFIRNLSFHCTDRNLLDHFNQNGFPVTLAKSYTSSPTISMPSTKPMYFGFVDLVDPSMADEAVQRLSNSYLLGRKISLEKFSENRNFVAKENFSGSANEQQQSGWDSSYEPSGMNGRDYDFGDRAYQLHVSFKAQDQSKKEILEKDLREMFQKYGRILDVIIKKHVFDADKRLGGYAFIQFERDESAHEAIRRTHNRIIDEIHYNCRWSMKHQNRSGSFDTTVASDSPSLSVRQFHRRSNHAPHYYKHSSNHNLHGPNSSALPPAPYLLGGQMPASMPSYGTATSAANQSSPFMMMQYPYGMLPAPSMDMSFGAPHGGFPMMMPLSTHVDESGSECYSSSDTQVYPPQYLPQLPLPLPMGMAIPPTAASAGMLPPPPFPPHMMVPAVPFGIPQHSGLEPKAYMFPGYFMPSADAHHTAGIALTAAENTTSVRAATADAHAPDGGTVGGSHNNTHDGTDTENSPPQQYLSTEIDAATAAYQTTSSVPPTASMMFSRLPESAISAAAFVPQQQQQLLPQQAQSAAQTMPSQPYFYQPNNMNIHQYQTGSPIYYPDATQNYNNYSMGSRSFDEAHNHPSSSGTGNNNATGSPSMAQPRSQQQQRQQHNRPRHNNHHQPHKPGSGSAGGSGSGYNNTSITTHASSSS